MVDPDRVRRLLERLSGYQAALTRLAAMPGDALRTDPDRMASVKYHFIVAIECCIDLANHIIAADRLRAPLDYADSFGVLIEAGLLERELGDEMRAAARFRNRLVHVYWDVDDGLVLDYLTDDSRPIARFAAQMARLVTDSR